MMRRKGGLRRLNEWKQERLVQGLQQDVRAVEVRG
jgi:hypothetical protein